MSKKPSPVTCLRALRGPKSASRFPQGPFMAAAVAMMVASALCLGGCKGSDSTDTNGTSDTSTSNGTTPSPTATNVGSSGDTINIGEYGSMTGGTATFGVSSLAGVQMAVAEANAKGGVLGKKLAVISKDDASDPEQASTAVEALLGQHVCAVLGEVASTRSLRGAPLCQKAGIPMISPASTNPKVTQVGDYIFRVCFIDPFQGPMIARIGTEVLHAKTAAILYDNGQDYSKGLRDTITSGFTHSGGTIVVERTYSSLDKSFQGQLTAIKAKNPDVIFIPGYYSEVSLIAKQARSLGMNQPLVGGDGWDSPELTKVAGSALNNCYFTDHFAPDDKNPVVQNFVKDYAKTNGGTPPDAMAALGYDAAGVLMDAMKRANSTDPKALRAAIAATKNFPGVTGNITLNADRNAVKPVVAIKIVNGKFTFFKRFNP